MESSKSYGTSLECGALDGRGFATNDKGLQATHVVEGLLSVGIGAGVNIAAHIDILDAFKRRAGIGIGAECVDFHHHRSGTLGDNQSLQVGAVGKFLAYGFVPPGNNGNLLKRSATVEHAASHARRRHGNGADSQ